jgi:FkbM family methyltransferase
LKGLARVIAESGTVLTASTLSCVYLYAQLQPGGGYLQSGRPDSGNLATSDAHRMSVRSWLASSQLARHVMRFQMRDGASVRSRVVDGGGLLSVYVDRDYDVPGLEWASMRTIVDIGAHVGTFTIWAAIRSPSARLLAVEPNPETFALLLENIRDNGLEDRVTAVNSAVGPESGTGSLELVEHSLGTRLARTTGRGPQVTVLTLPTLLRDAGLTDVDMLKVDCEGMEYSVFGMTGPQGLRSIGAVACEYHPEPGHHIGELDALFATAGFGVHRPNAPLGVLWATR